MGESGEMDSGNLDSKLAEVAVSKDLVGNKCEGDWFAGFAIFYGKG
jgi:hypothetical protein